MHGARATPMASGGAARICERNDSREDGSLHERQRRWVGCALRTIDCRLSIAATFSAASSTHTLHAACDTNTLIAWCFQCVWLLHRPSLPRHHCHGRCYLVTTSTATNIHVVGAKRLHVTSSKQCIDHGPVQISTTVATMFATLHTAALAWSRRAMIVQPRPPHNHMRLNSAGTASRCNLLTRRTGPCTVCCERNSFSLRTASMHATDAGWEETATLHPRAIHRPRVLAPRL
jgi:hypothetical protein